MIIIYKICPVCKQEFRTRVHSGNGRKYCSLECRKIGAKKAKAASQAASTTERKD